MTNKLKTVSRFVKQQKVAVGVTGLLVVFGVAGGAYGLLHTSSLNDGQAAPGVRTKQFALAPSRHLQTLKTTTPTASPGATSTPTKAATKSAPTPASVAAAAGTVNGLRLPYGQPVVSPPIVFQTSKISDPTNCQTFPVDMTLMANVDTVLTYHTEFTSGGRTPSQQVAFKKGEVKTIHVDVPYNVPATDRMISGVFTFVLESPEYRTQVTNLDPGLFNRCNSYPDNPYN